MTNIIKNLDRFAKNSIVNKFSLSKGNEDLKFIVFYGLGSILIGCIFVYDELVKSTVCFTDLDHGSDILSRFSLPKSMKHTVDYEHSRLFILELFSQRSLALKSKSPVPKMLYVFMC
jgi:hypothetical protein